MANALWYTNSNPSLKDKVPLATNAENSPKECPATISAPVVSAAFTAAIE